MFKLIAIYLDKLQFIFADYKFFRWLFRDDLLPKKTHFVGFARSKLKVAEIKEMCLPNMKVGLKCKSFKTFSLS